MLMGKAFHKFGMDFPAVPAFRTAMAEWLVGMPDLVQKGLRSNPLWKQEGGLEKVDEGMELLKAGKVRFSLASLPIAFGEGGVEEASSCSVTDASFLSCFSWEQVSGTKVVFQF